ncbi:DAK2 domain-containing protein [Clostridium algidicarnis]|uniref:DAK2 domain-containing protein n=1 Tax=Clostridium algidicarnis TaxID=37659 RepID=UPI0016288E15|nr:DAK2 domain-containing protein [Clostridium algidicarnis]MBB6631176.1 DAK2 domain-containing protein [Clostridium algidicarnis]MBB6696172.1 DAK2 domain-containing protein [Clostridium algidicarnis]MBU3203208.1 DAK2 domain-containing protein [Clostridium algidicarnis]MBU3211362.1 DAK2 domain-containing protein [Clostridium algidicarnis]MBU3222130.1 DAK2 domain-containing protein [Clostridium algidicarnis]
MKYLKINGEHFYNVMVNASNKLEEQKEFVNSLNVFPVPDGDTGTNMSMTFKAAVKEIEDMNSKSISEVSKKLAKGALMGARGNSGVILSQILRGIAKGLEGKEEANAEEFAESIMEGSRSAYKAVMRPIEGTILTVVRSAGENALKSKAKDITLLMDDVCKGAEDTLNKTPDMLPVLKSAKVVDSGGMGLLIILKGIHEALRDDVKSTLGDFHSIATNISAANNLEPHDIKFGYCTEFIILGDSSKAEDFKREVEAQGDSMIVVGYEDVIKVHIHTNDPGNVLSKAVAIGELSKIKIDNMREEHRSLIIDQEKYKEETKEEQKKYGFISVSMGEGIEHIFKDLGVDYIIPGGQTMNPSTEEIVKSIEKVNAENIFILPNNKNIIMSATQAAELSEKNVVVIPTKSIPQGITCVTMFNPDGDVEENLEVMKESIESVISASITYAVRDTEMDGIEIKEGNILGLVEGKIKEVGSEIYEVSEKLLEKIVDEDKSLITLFYGADCTKEEVEKFALKLEGIYENIDIQFYEGKQPLYYFIISVE